MSARRSAPLALPLLLALGCTSTKVGPPVPEIDRRPTEPHPDEGRTVDADGRVVDQATPDELAGVPVTVAGTGLPRLLAFAAEIGARCPENASVGVLPLPYFAANRAEPESVPALGVELADLLASQIEASERVADVLTTREIQSNLEEMNAPNQTLYTIGALEEYGDRIGVDVVVFGTIREMKRRRDRFELEVQMTAFDAFQGRQVATCLFALSEERRFARWNATAWDRREDPSFWKPTAEVDDDFQPSLAEELPILTANLARRLDDQIDIFALTADQSIYVAPADSAAFSAKIANLRALQITIRQEERARELHTERTGELLQGPVTVASLQFPDLASAKAYRNEEIARVKASDATRFCIDVSSDLAEAMRPYISPTATLFESTSFSFAQLDALQVDLASGGLVEDSATWEELERLKIGLVVLPRFERIGENYRLRARLYTLGPTTPVASPYVLIHERYTDELAKELELAQDNPNLDSLESR